MEFAPPPASLPPRIPAHCARDVEQCARVMSSSDAPCHRASRIARAHVRARVRTYARPCCCCGSALLRSPHAGIALAVTRGFRNARDATEVHARLGTAPCVALNWGWSACFSPLLPIDDHRPSCDRKRTYGRPDHQTAIRGTMLLPLASSGTDARPRGHSPAAAPLQGGMEPNSPQ